MPMHACRLAGIPPALYQGGCSRLQYLSLCGLSGSSDLIKSLKKQPNPLKSLLSSHPSLRRVAHVGRAGWVQGAGGDAVDGPFPHLHWWAAGPEVADAGALQVLSCSTVLCCSRQQAGLWPPTSGTGLGAATAVFGLCLPPRMPSDCRPPARTWAKTCRSMLWLAFQ